MRCKEKNNVPHGINNTNMPKKTIETTRVYLVKSKEKKEKISSEASPLGGEGGGEGTWGVPAYTPLSPSSASLV